MLISTTLQALTQEYDRRFLADDPVSIVHTYTTPAEKEIAGLICSLLAFGNANTIIASAKKALRALEKPSLTASFRHRWISGDDLLLLFGVLKKALKEYGSLENIFLEGLGKEDENIAEALNHFSGRMLQIALTLTLSQKTGEGMSRGFRYFFPSPKDGSPCKRLNMYLRWMVRPADGIDLGLWKKIPTSKLIIPLDTHIYQFARLFKISKLKNPGWQMAVDVTNFLKKLDPLDPVKFDFAICHHGMHNGWLNGRKNKKSQRGAEVVGAAPRLQKS